VGCAGCWLAAGLAGQYYDRLVLRDSFSFVNRVPVRFNAVGDRDLTGGGNRGRRDRTGRDDDASGGGG
jgi:hypothetical protein